MANEAMHEGFHTVTPYLTTRKVSELVEFVKQAFGAVETYQGTGSAGGLHVQVRIGDSMVMIGGGPALDEPMSAMLYLYMEDVDAVYRRALDAGATSVSEPADQSYGDRVAGVRDASGNIWYIGTPLM